MPTMTSGILHLENRGQGAFGVGLEEDRLQPWNTDMLFAYLVAHGYANKDAEMLVAKAMSSRQMQIVIPDPVAVA
jgi:hypothetical protein